MKEYATSDLRDLKDISAHASTEEKDEVTKDGA